MEIEKDQIEFIAEQRELQEKETLQMPGARERYQICQKCDKFWPTIKGCSVCCCFMPVKTRIKSMKCPIGKW